MIVTVTLNPSLDYTMQVPDFVPGRVCRSAGETIYPGGKGLNVSLMLARLGLKSTALGFAAGFTGQELERILTGLGCRCEFIQAQTGMTRINVKLKTAQECDINGLGPQISPGELELLCRKLDTLKQDDILVLAGSLPPSLPENCYEDILARLEGRGIQFVVDTEGIWLLNTLKHRPFLVKPNHHELGGLFGTEPQNTAEIIRMAKELQARGARNVLVSLAKDGAVLIPEKGDVQIADAPKGKLINSVGAGDSMIAGFLAGYVRTKDASKALSLGVAAGSATAFSSWLAEAAQVAALLENPEMFGLSLTKENCRLP